MTIFNDFTKSDWNIFYGNLLMLFVCIFYIAWWTVSFRPNGSGKPAVAMVLLAVTVISAIASVVVLARGISTAPQTEKGVQVQYIFIGAAAAYVVLFLITKIALNRPVTTELFIMILWAAGELSVVDALYKSGRFGVRSAAGLIVLTAVATCIGIVCYILYYRLDEAASFRAGLIPLAADAGAVATFLAVQALL